MFSQQHRLRFELFKNELKARTWWLRSRFISKSMRNRAYTYLNDNQTQMIFVMGSGRSGTQLLSNLLDSAGTAKVYHEPNFWEDVGTMDILRRNRELAVQYWKDFRSFEVYRRWMEEPVTPKYGEINATIRYQTPAIKQVFPKAKMLMVVRDGRGVVRSVMGWPQFYGPDSKGAYALSPLPGDPYLEEWPKMSRFEKICWSLNDTNTFLMEHIPKNMWLQLERLTTDYDYFTAYFSQYLDIEISYSCWRSRVRQKSKNATKKYGFPEWRDWSVEQKQAYVRICGETMETLGYDILQEG